MRMLSGGHPADTISRLMICRLMNAMEKLLPEPTTLDHLLAQVSRLHHHRAHELLGELGLYRGQPPVLFALWKQDGQTLGELARLARVTPATMTRMVQRMEKAGFVLRKPDPADQRVSRVHVTQAGRAIRRKLERVWAQMDQDNFVGLTAIERQTLERLLLRVRDNLAGAINDEGPF